MTLSKGKSLLLLLLLCVFVWVSGCATNEPIATAPGNQSLAVQEQPVVPISPKHIDRIQTTDTPEISTVTITGGPKFIYTSVKQSFPLGVVLYFPQTVLNDRNPSAVQGSDLINTIEASDDSRSGAAKISILLQKDTPYEVIQSESDLKVVFKKQSMAAIPAQYVLPVQNGGMSQNTMPIEAVPVSNSSSMTFSSSSKPAWVNRVDFASEMSGKSTVTIGTTAAVKYDIQKTSDTTLNVNLYNTNIPDYHQRQLITTRFESAVDRILPVQRPEMKNRSMVSIELREAVPHYVEQNGNVLLIRFDASGIPPRPIENANLPSWKKMLDQPVSETLDASPVSETEGGVSVAESGKDFKFRTTDQYFDDKNYTGEKISLDFYETDIKNVFRILREISGKNFIIDDDVKGKVTMTLDKPVPWDQILDLVLKMNQLGLVYEGDIIRIATLATIKRESNALLDSISAEREAKEKIKDMAPLVTEYVAISYSKAKDEILPHIKDIITENRGSVSVDERNNQIIITDTAEKIAMAKSIIKNIDKVTPQVIIEAKVVEVSKTMAKDIGVDWAAAGGIQNDDANAGIGPQRGMDILGGTYGWETAMNFPVTDAGQIGFNFARIAGTPFVLNAKLSALEVSGDAKVISSPKIVTLDNKKAMIRQGLEVGYFDNTESAEEQRDVEFKKVDLLLEVTPHVTPDSRVAMSIFITKNDVDQFIDGIPSIATNEAQTELLVNDGDTIVIGGIMKTTRATGESGFPGLSKIPGLGRLFRLNSEDNRNNELLIFITPRIVQLEQKDM